MRYHNTVVERGHILLCSYLPKFIISYDISNDVPSQYIDRCGSFFDSTQFLSYKMALGSVFQHPSFVPMFKQKPTYS